MTAPGGLGVPDNMPETMTIKSVNVFLVKSLV